jgi:hypothetical protein
MAKLISPLKIRGTIDDLSFRQTEDGIIVQAKPGPRPEQVRTSKNFELTRRNAREFGKATKDAMLLRHAMGYPLRALRHSKLNSHVNKQLHAVAKSDKTSEYGSRHANAGNIQSLAGFNFNHLLGLDTAMPVTLEHAMDTATGAFHLHVPACTIRRKKVFPAGATHCKIVSCTTALDFDEHRFLNDIAESDLLPLGKQLPSIDLSHSLCVSPEQVMVHTVGIVFYQVNGGNVEPLRGGALKIVQVGRVEEIKMSVGCAKPGASILFAESPARFAEVLSREAEDSAGKSSTQKTNLLYTFAHIENHTIFNDLHLTGPDLVILQHRSNMCHGITVSG